MPRKKGQLSNPKRKSIAKPKPAESILPKVTQITEECDSQVKAATKALAQVNVKVEPIEVRAQLKMPFWHTKVLRGMDELRLEQKLCDVTVLSKEGSLHLAHMCVLAAASSLFKNRFAADMKAGIKCHLVQTEISDQIMPNVLKFIYSGVLNFGMDEMPSAIVALKGLGISVNTTTLKWTEGIVTAMDKYRTEGFLCDVNIVTTDNLVYTVHSSILTAVSDVLKTNINADMVVLIRCHCMKMDLDSKLLPLVLQILYTGEAETVKDNAEHVVRALEALGVDLEGEQTRKRKKIVAQEEKYQKAMREYRERERERIEKGLPRVTRRQKMLAKKAEREKEKLKPVICEHCGLVFEGQKLLAVHKKRKHTKRKLNPFRVRKELPKTFELCTQCGASVSSTYMASHLERHRGIKHKCKICDKEYNFRSTLISHQKQHKEGFTGFPCKVCGKVCKYQATLSQHMKIEHHNFRYHCQYCEKKFKHKENLRQHVFLHTGEKPFTCRVCGKAFRQRNCMKAHELIHTVARFECPLCATKFRARSSRQRHLRNVHKIRAGDPVPNLKEGLLGKLLKGREAAPETVHFASLI